LPLGENHILVGQWRYFEGGLFRADFSADDLTHISDD
jgi:hypothetical protein